MKCSECQGKGFMEYEHGLIMVEHESCKGTGEIDDIDSGTESDNQLTRSADTSQPKQPSKLKSKRKARKRTN